MSVAVGLSVVVLGAAIVLPYVRFRARQRRSSDIREALEQLQRLDREISELHEMVGARKLTPVAKEAPPIGRVVGDDVRIYDLLGLPALIGKGGARNPLAIKDVNTGPVLVGLRPKFYDLGSDVLERWTEAPDPLLEWDPDFAARTRASKSH